MWPDIFCKGSPLPVGRVDLSAAASGTNHSGFAIAAFYPDLYRKEDLDQSTPAKPLFPLKIIQKYYFHKRTLTGL
jgi:hypothetical protein